MTKSLPKKTTKVHIICRLVAESSTLGNGGNRWQSQIGQWFE